MNQDQLSSLISLGEGPTLEFKHSPSSNLGCELCAFANSSGEKILLGVADDGSIVGIPESNRLISKIQSIAHSAEPRINIEIQRIGTILCVNIPVQQGKPFSFGSKFYIRSGPNTQRMSRDEVVDIIDKEGLIHFDRSPCYEYSLDRDLDDETWTLFRNRAKIPVEMAPISALRNLLLINNDEQITNAAAWLLARDIRKFHTSADVSCGLFMGTDKVRILDRRDFHGDIYSMIDETMNWILSKLNIEFVIEALQREEIPELPAQAIREAVVNAFAHRNYRSTANIQIYLFSDRLEIVSPGGLPAGMTEAELGIKSIPRNPLLFNLLYRMDAVEHIGSGIRRIRSLCKEHGVADPIIRVSEDWFTTTFLRSTKSSERIKNIPSEEGIFQTGTKSGLSQDQTGTKLGLSQDQTGTKLGLSQDQTGTKLGLSQDHVELIQNCENPKTAENLMRLVQRKNRSKFREKVLNPLIKSGLLEMTIPDKPRSRHQKYQLTKAGKTLHANLKNKLLSND